MNIRLNLELSQLLLVGFIVGTASFQWIHNSPNPANLEKTLEVSKSSKSTQQELFSMDTSLPPSFPVTNLKK